LKGVNFYDLRFALLSSKDIVSSVQVENLRFYEMRELNQHQVLISHLLRATL